MNLVLASSSPRRRELLALLRIPFEAVAPDGVDETPVDGESPPDLAARLAAEKARSAEGDVVIGADTVVEIDGEILGKPVDADDARRMLERLSGRSHLVHTGVAVRSGAGIELEVVTTSVRLAPVSDEMIEWYVATGEPLDKAGAYAIQGAGGVFVVHLEGSVTNVVGLPLDAVVRLLARRGIRGFAAGHPRTKPSGGAKPSDGVAG